MTGILNNEAGSEWPGTRYASSHVDPKVIADHVAKAKIAINLENTAGADRQEAPIAETSDQKPPEDKFARLGKALEEVSTTRPGWWF